MDVSSKKLPAIIIAVLLVILVAQYFINDSANRSRLIDPDTCQIYTKDSQIGTKHYLDEFDTKCLEFKEHGSEGGQ